MAGWPRWERLSLLYRRLVPTRSLRERVVPFREFVARHSPQIRLPGIVLLAAVLGDLAIIVKSSVDEFGPVGLDLLLIPGIVVLAACAVWSYRSPLPAGITGAGVLLMSTALIVVTGTPAYTALLEKITFGETVAGVQLVYYAVSRLRPIWAVFVTGTLVSATVVASVTRAGLWHFERNGLLVTAVGGAALLLMTVVAGIYHRRPRRPSRERNELVAFLRGRWPLVTVLSVLLFLELSYVQPPPSLDLLALLCCGGTAVVAVLGSKFPARAVVYYCALILVSGVLYRYTGPLYSTFYGMALSQVVSGMVLLVMIVRYEATKRATWLVVVQSVTVGLVTLVHTPVAYDSPTLRTAFSMALLALGICVAIGMFLKARDSERARMVETAVGDAQTAERMALARELHDVVAHHVTGIVVQAQAARMVAEQNPAVVTDALAQIERAGTDAMTAMRRLVRSMRGDAPAGASEFSEQATTDLAADLRRLVDTGNHGIPTELTVDLPGDLPPEVARSALRLVQESLTNVGKHAKDASRAIVGVCAVGEQLHIRIADDGRGSAEKTRASRTSDDSGYGLVGMRERVDLLHGRLRAGPSPEGGWLVEAWIPLRTERNGE
ncbi:sensor histidine kinase [Saccharomonospora azurea]|uniref:sensor histidine kinase n=1 Tax=Saccharomonospora azurea TaxID=40988 RepID=UPI0002FF4681|nr:histidine kinase [Saccharomonospora azurea]